MKTIFSTHNNQSLHKWKNLNEFLVKLGLALSSYWLAAPSLMVCYFGAAWSKMNLFLRTIRAHVVRVQPVTRASMHLPVRSGIVNNRVYVGLVLVIIVAPLSACIHMLPNMKEVVSEEWFYKCWYNLYLVLGPYFFCLCIVIAAFLWIPPSAHRIKFTKKDLSFQLTRALCIPFGYIIGKIVWLICCDNNEDFERLGHPLFFLGGIIIGYITFLFLEYLVWKQEHVMNALCDSLEGLYKIQDLDCNTRESMAAPYWKELRQFNSKY